MHIWFKMVACLGQASFRPIPNYSVSSEGGEEKMPNKWLWLSTGPYWIGATLTCKLYSGKKPTGPIDLSFLTADQIKYIEYVTAVLFCIAVVLAWIFCSSYLLSALFISVLVYGGLYGSKLLLPGWAWLVAGGLPLLGLLLNSFNDPFGYYLRKQLCIFSGWEVERRRAYLR